MTHVQENDRFSDANAAADATYTYDSENRLIKRTGGTGLADITMTYDADGNHVGKVVSGGATIFA